MAILFVCPECRAKYEIDDSMAGKSMVCRECDQRCTVPGSSATPAPAIRKKLPSAPPNGLWVALATVIVGLMGFAGIYYWSHPLPWERLGRQPLPDSARVPPCGRGFPRGGPGGGPFGPFGPGGGPPPGPPQGPPPGGPM